jgi:hypothetical protein
MKRFIWAALLCVLASPSSLAQQRRATGKYDSKPVDIARKVASRCTLVLTAPR